VHLIASGQLNTYDVLVSDDVVFTRQALDEFVSVAGKGQTALAVDAPGGRHAATDDSEISLSKKSPVQDEDDTTAAEAVATEEGSA
jgi:large subunit ribosomal protein L4